MNSLAWAAVGLAIYLALAVLVAAVCGTDTRTPRPPVEPAAPAPRPSTGDKKLDDWIAYRGRSFG